MKFKKTLTSLLLIPVLIPTIGIVSCSKNNQVLNELQDTIVPALKSDNIQMKLDFKDPNIINYKIGDLNPKNVNFSLIVNDKLNDKEYLDDLQKLIDKTTYKFIDYVIPKINDDENSYLIFELNYKNFKENVYIKLSNLKINQKNKLQNLNLIEIKKSINEKLNNWSGFYENLSHLIKVNIEKHNQLDIPTLVNTNSTQLSQILSTYIKLFIYSSTFFYYEYDNLYIDSSSFIISENKNSTFNLNFKIFTSNQSSASNYYKIECPFLISEKFALINELRKINEGIYENSNLNIDSVNQDLEQLTIKEFLEKYFKLDDYQDSISSGSLFNFKLNSKYEISKFHSEKKGNEIILKLKVQNIESKIISNEFKTIIIK